MVILFIQSILDFFTERFLPFFILFSFILWIRKNSLKSIKTFLLLFSLRAWRAFKGVDLRVTWKKDLGTPNKNIILQFYCENKINSRDNSNNFWSSIKIHDSHQMLVLEEKIIYAKFGSNLSRIEWINFRVMKNSGILLVLVMFFCGAWEVNDFSGSSKVIK